MTTVAQTVIRAPAPAKLNLFLHVLGQRADGYHLLQTAFTLVDWQDELCFKRRDDGQIIRLNDMPGVAPEEDLVVRAARLLQAHTGTHLGAEIHVDKQLPSGAGLGGGSSDAATTLMALNYLWQTGLSDAELAELGVQLGADVPVFIFGQDAFAQGIGEELQALNLVPQAYVLIQPDLAIPTPAIFKSPQLKRDTAEQSFAQVEQGLQSMQAVNQELKQGLQSRQAINQALEQGQGSPQQVLGIPKEQSRTLSTSLNIRYYGHNDLEKVALLLYPALQHLVHALHQQGWPVRMTGSGSCFFLPVKDIQQAHEVALQVRSWADTWQTQSADHLAIKYVQVCQSLQAHPIKALLGV
ncbi:MAG: 4-(cytidine 5'-diphospho)-2-C-methyl-D-erythritol kinase [Pelistega sp.]|nr:4-(cytidine 5'-diphospho)-2-C-methyl-D-erythritol kinase [Pelistega sp.]